MPPEGFSMNNWGKKDCEVMTESPLTVTPGLKVEMPDDTDSLYFLKLF